MTHTGWLRAIGAIDFAGGTSVHINAAFSALAAAIIVGPREITFVEEEVGFFKEFMVINFFQEKLPTKNFAYVILGAGLLWFGWFGFNGGSSLASGTIAAVAFLNTQVPYQAGDFCFLFSSSFFLFFLLIVCSSSSGTFSHKT